MPQPGGGRVHVCDGHHRSLATVTRKGLMGTYHLIVTQRVSVPEKTLEHWASQYIMYRYRAQASLWWPATGQDIDVSLLPAEPGKAVQLELKTTRRPRPLAPGCRA